MLSVKVAIYISDSIKHYLLGYCTNIRKSTDYIAHKQDLFLIFVYVPVSVCFKQYVQLLVIRLLWSQSSK